MAAVLNPLRFLYPATYLPEGSATPVAHPRAGLEVVSDPSDAKWWTVDVYNLLGGSGVTPPAATVDTVVWTPSPEAVAAGVLVLAQSETDTTVSVKLNVDADSRSDVSYDGAGTSYQLAFAVDTTAGDTFQKTIEILFRRD